MYEVGHIYQSIWATPVDLAKGTINVYNENFFRDLSDYAMEWQLLGNGEVLQSGTIETMDVAPQETKQFELPYTTDGICKCKELLLNVSFKLKKADGLLPAGFAVAKNQLSVRPYEAKKLDIQNAKQENIEVVTPTLKDNDVNYLIVSGNNFRMDFNRHGQF